jgi:stage V sporulation protein SpoVS
MDSLVPYNFAQAITKSDSVNIATVGAGAKVDAIYVGGAGTIVAVFANGETATITGALAGTILPISVVRVNSANTTATNLLALYRV